MTKAASPKKTGLFKIIKNAGSSFSNDKAMKMSASLSYYTVFSVGPLLLIIITLAGVFVSRDTIVDLMNNQLNDLVGASAGKQILDIITNLQAQIAGKATLFATVAIVTLIFGATGVFLEIQDSINTIWCIKAKPKKGWLKFLTNRLLSFSLIVGLGFLLLVSLMVNTLTDALLHKLAGIFGGQDAYFFKVVNLLVLYLVITLLFSVIFKVLPDAKIHWRDAMIGAAATGILFLIGKFAIGFYIGNSDFGNTYGTAASVIVLLTWVYYSSVILFFGAEFTKEWAMTRGHGIAPNDTAVLIEKTEVKELPGKKHAGPDDIPVEVL